jgi:hypothetical protein
MVDLLDISIQPPIEGVTMELRTAKALVEDRILDLGYIQHNARMEGKPSNYGHLHLGESPEEDPYQEYFTMPHCAYGSYAGDAVTRANSEYLQHNYPGLFTEIYDAFGTSGLILCAAEYLPETLVDTLIFLNDYPALDEDRTWEIQQESLEEYLSVIMYPSIEFEISEFLERDLSVNEVNRLKNVFDTHYFETDYRGDAQQLSTEYNAEDVYICPQTSETMSEWILRVLMPEM